MAIEQANDRLEHVYQAGGDRETLDTAYAGWAADYDRDLWAFGYATPGTAAAMLARLAPELDARILDCGCGTGLLGEILSRIGYIALEGLDASSEMLTAAKAKGCYSALYETLLGETVAGVEGLYDVVTALGVLTVGHAPPSSLEGMVKLTKPGGLLLFAISDLAMESGGFGDAIEALDQRAAWKQIQVSDSYPCLPYSVEPDLNHRLYAYRRS